MIQSFIGQSHRPEVRGGRLLPSSTTGADNDFATHASKLTKSIASIVLGPRSDFVIKLLERSVDPEEAVHFLYFEDLGSSWGFRFDGESLLFVTKNETLRPRLVYLRGVVIEPSDNLWQPIGELFEALNCAPIEVLGRPCLQTTNESKLFQITHSLVGSLKGPACDVGVSFVRKGQSEVIESLPSSADVIVKSLSGIRSVVSSRQDFETWPKEGLAHLPALFQKRVDGADVRVHVLGQRIWALKVQDKSEVDYRYAATRSEMHEIDLPNEVKEFCFAVSRYENNPLLGLDFIQTPDGRFVCLEANPGPGWAWYHEQELCKESFLERILEALKNGKI